MRQAILPVVEYSVIRCHGFGSSRVCVVRMCGNAEQHSVGNTIKDLRSSWMTKSGLSGVVCACLFTLFSATALAELVTANTPNCGVDYGVCDDSAFLTAVAAEGGNVPLDAALNFEQDKLGSPL